ncbi:hypothetical protein ID866_3379 [Astraeus odoratus]|nr:hypothetical protein ID866_3379 [Astraeus odoratus]
MDVEALLSQLPSRATRYHCINLNGLVIRDKELVCHGRGGHAIVYKGSLRHTGTRVAVKTAIRGSTTDEDMIKKVFKEVHAWSKFKHENVLPLIGITTDFDFTVSIVSRWMVLGNARTYVQNPAIDPRPLVVGIARGLSYLHKHPKGSIVHGDLKGQNVLISDDGHALIADFGLTYLENSSFSFASNLTQGGSYHWMSPEIITSKQQISTESDVWAFGMTVLVCLSRLLTC